MLDDIAASGFRRTTTAGRRAIVLADGYTGLPEGVTRWRLAAALRAAASAIGLTSPMLRLLEHYIDLTYDQDWAADSEPVITRPLVEIADHLGRTERQVRNIERALVEKGLLAWRDSGNHHRKGRRDRYTGRLVYAYGPSLAPLGARAAEILDRAQAARAEIAAARRMRIAISALRRRIRAGLAAAAETGLPASAGLAAQLEALPDRNPAGLSLAVLVARRDALISVAAEVEAMLEDAGVETQRTDFSETSGLPEIIDRHKTDTCKNSSINESIASRNAKRPADGAGCGLNGVDAVPMALALTAAGPEMRNAMAGCAKPSWRALTEAAHMITPLLGIDQELWGETCAKLGRPGAALAILILERAMTRRDTGAAQPVKRPDAYLRGMLVRAEQGALHLDRSVRAWAQRGDDAVP